MTNYYPLNSAKKLIAAIITQSLYKVLNKGKIEINEHEVIKSQLDDYDFSFPCFNIAKQFGYKPLVLANELANALKMELTENIGDEKSVMISDEKKNINSKLKDEKVESVSAPIKVGTNLYNTMIASISSDKGYINFRLAQTYLAEIMNNILTGNFLNPIRPDLVIDPIRPDLVLDPIRSGLVLDPARSDLVPDNVGVIEESRQKIMIEYSQPNTHKIFHVGHMRNVALGDSLIRIYEQLGFPVVAANYFGDEGTHVATCLWQIWREIFGDNKSEVSSTNANISNVCLTSCQVNNVDDIKCVNVHGKNNKCVDGRNDTDICHGKVDSKVDDKVDDKVDSKVDDKVDGKVDGKVDDKVDDKNNNKDDDENLMLKYLSSIPVDERANWLGEMYVKGIENLSLNSLTIYPFLGVIPAQVISISPHPNLDAPREWMVVKVRYVSDLHNSINEVGEKIKVDSVSYKSSPEYSSGNIVTSTVVCGGIGYSINDWVAYVPVGAVYESKTICAIDKKDVLSHGFILSEREIGMTSMEAETEMIKCLSPSISNTSISDLFSLSPSLSPSTSFQSPVSSSPILSPFQSPSSLSDQHPSTLSSLSLSTQHPSTLSPLSLSTQQPSTLSSLPQSSKSQSTLSSLSKSQSILSLSSSQSPSTLLQQSLAVSSKNKKDKIFVLPKFLPRLFGTIADQVTPNYPGDQEICFNSLGDEDRRSIAMASQGGNMVINNTLVEIGRRLKSDKGTRNYIKVMDEYNRRQLQVKNILKQLEASDDSLIVKLWKQTRQWSLDEFARIYKWLDVRFDYNFSESEVSHSALDLVEKLKADGKLVKGDIRSVVGSDCWGINFDLDFKNIGSKDFSDGDIKSDVSKCDSRNARDKSVGDIDVKSVGDIDVKSVSDRKNKIVSVKSVGGIIDRGVDVKSVNNRSDKIVGDKNINNRSDKSISDKSVIDKSDKSISDKSVKVVGDRNVKSISDGNIQNNNDKKLSKYKGLGFCMLQKSNGSTLYATKDLALAVKKFNEFKIVHSIYVVASEQIHHFKQVFAALDYLNLMEETDGNIKKCYHLPYGMVRLKADVRSDIKDTKENKDDKKNSKNNKSKNSSATIKAQQAIKLISDNSATKVGSNNSAIKLISNNSSIKMSSRKGNVIPFHALKNMLTKYISDNYMEKYRAQDNAWSEEQIDNTIRVISVAIIKYGMLKKDSMQDIIFDLDEWGNPVEILGLIYYIHILA